MSSPANIVLSRIKVYLGAIKDTDNEGKARANMIAKRKCLIDLVKDELKDLEKIIKDLEANQKTSFWGIAKDQKAKKTFPELETKE